MGEGAEGQNIWANLRWSQSPSVPWLMRSGPGLKPRRRGPRGRRLTYWPTQGPLWLHLLLRPHTYPSSSHPIPLYSSILPGGNFLFTLAVFSAYKLPPPRSPHGLTRSAASNLRSYLTVSVRAARPRAGAQTQPLPDPRASLRLG